MRVSQAMLLGGRAFGVDGKRTFALNSLCTRVGSFLEREVDGEILLLDTETNRIHQLNKTASLIWRQYREGVSPELIAEVLAKDFEVAHDQIRADVERTVGQFVQLGMKARIEEGK